MSAAKVVFVLGGPGSGKGTQCTRLAKEKGFIHLSAGDLLRAEAATGSSTADLINGHIKNGTIVPFQVTIDLLKKAMEGKDTTFLIDGFPRAMDQALEFEKQVKLCEFILFLDVPEAVLEKRLLERGKTSGRVDDNLEAIKKRFNTFVNTSMPVVDHYKQQDKVRTINGDRDVEVVYAEIAGLFNAGASTSKK